VKRGVRWLSAAKVQKKDGFETAPTGRCDRWDLRSCGDTILGRSYEASFCRAEIGSVRLPIWRLPAYDHCRTLSLPVGLVEMEAVAFDDDCLLVRDEVALNDLSLTRTGAPISVHEDQLSLFDWYPGR
jgi:hypothetical protein